ncbi:hypothetical protein AB6E04_05435 [Vibrio amylolyticus]|uniref:hypothetical protein n=1 Tax=Vibrio amylolyticus TaxID=2847292 RepID=UPI00354EDED0
MATQALTKGRLVQIVITLAILIGAFSWRTITHSEAQSVDCKQQTTCSFNVKNTNIEVVFSQDQLTLTVNDPNIDVYSTLEVIDSNENQSTLGLSKSSRSQPQSFKFTFANNDIYQVTINNMPQ